MTSMAPEDVVTALVRACDARDLDAVCALVTDDIEYDNVPIGKVHGPEGVRSVLSGGVTQAAAQVEWRVLHQVASGDVVMRVRDTGVGMSTAEIEQALKPFKQINSLKRTRTDGTGLGLPLTKAMVEANRARFAINSSPGEGTLVEICFPSTRVLAD